MISVHTVFLLGAGASKPYGLPTGDELSRLIWNGIVQSEPRLFLSLIECGHSADLIEQFGRDFRDSGGVSIDTFLAHRHEYADVGRHAIAAVLLPREDATSLHGDWYGYLWKLLIDGAKSAEEVQENNVQFLTFNYDRSLDHFLYRAGSSLFKLAPESARRFVSKFNIHHVYGLLGEAGEYGQKNTADIIRAAEDIQVMPNTRPKIDEKAFAILDSADQLFIAGFAFDQMNCERVGLGKVLEKRRRFVEATCFKMNLHEQNVAKAHIDVVSSIRQAW